MKKFIFSLCLMAATAFAQNYNDALDFKIISHGKAGCLGLDDVWAPLGFNFPNGQAQIVRLLYSTVSPDSVNENSEHFEFVISDDGASLETNGELCGLESGKHYYFKGQLLTKEKQSLFVTPDSSYNPERHTGLAP